MNKLMVGSIAIAMFLLAGCGAAGEGPTEPGPIISVEAIVGTWQRTSGGIRYLQFREDGTTHSSRSLEAVIEGHGQTQWKYRIEGTQLILEETLGVCEENPTGIYEVHLLENGNLQFVSVEDECPSRVSFLAGRPDEGITREYEPVP